MATFDDPLELFRVAVERMNADDFRGAAQCCDPVSLRAHQRASVARFAESGAGRVLRLEDFRNVDPDMPQELTEYNLRKHQEAMVTWGDVSREFPGLADLDALRAAAPDVVYAAYLKGHSTRWLLARYMEDGVISEADLGISEQLNAFREHVRAIGVIEVSPSLAHIFYAHGFVESDAALQRGTSDPWVAKELARIAALPTDEQALHAELQGNYSPRSTHCRRQPDGGWLLLAGHEFPGVSTGLTIGHAGPDDVEGDP